MCVELTRKNEKFPFHFPSFSWQRRGPAAWSSCARSPTSSSRGCSVSLPSGPGPAFPEENTAPALRKPIRGATDSNLRPRQSAVWGSPIRVHPITMPSQGQLLALRPWGPAQPSSCSNPLFLAPGAPWDPPPAPVVRGPEGALVLRLRDQASMACLKRLKAQYKHCQHEMNFAAES